MLIDFTGSITLRNTKGSGLTYAELDDNFSYLNNGSIIGSYLPYSQVQPLMIGNGDGFGDVVLGEVSPSMIGGITGSQLVTLDVSGAPTELKFVTASLSQSGSFLGIALETKNPGEPIKILTQGYYSVFSSGSATPGFIKESGIFAGSPVYFSGSYITTVKPGTTAQVRPLGFCFNTEPILNGIKLIKFSPSQFTLS